MLSTNVDQHSRLVNLTLLSIVNGLFFYVGIFLNSVVIIVGLVRSKQHLKSLCSFMILVLTCFDLGTVVVCHPLIITSTYIWSTGDYDSDGNVHRVKRYSNILFHFSFMALLVMNIDRFLAVHYPFFHRQAITRRRLLVLLGVLLTVIFTERIISYSEIFGIVCHVSEAVIVGLLLLIITIFNLKMFVISTARRKVTTGVSTCLLAVVCFVLFSSPLFVYSAMQFSPQMMHGDNAMLFSLWATTLACMNSSMNCLIFFWRDRRLREEGAKVLRGLFKWPGSTCKTVNH